MEIVLLFIIIFQFKLQTLPSIPGIRRRNVSRIEVFGQGSSNVSVTPTRSYANVTTDQFATVFTSYVKPKPLFDILGSDTPPNAPTPQPQSQSNKNTLNPIQPTLPPLNASTAQRLNSSTPQQLNSDIIDMNLPNSDLDIISINSITLQGPGSVSSISSPSVSEIKLKSSEGATTNTFQKSSTSSTHPAYEGFFKASLKGETKLELNVDHKGTNADLKAGEASKIDAYFENLKR